MKPEIQSSLDRMNAMLDARDAANPDGHAARMRRATLDARKRTGRGVSVAVEAGKFTVAETIGRKTKFLSEPMGHDDAVEFLRAL